jgi:hypothetical protein
MALELNTPVAEKLNNRIQPKLVEIGWSGGEESSPLSEYICLMLVNGKSQSQIAAELSGDLLGLAEGDSSAIDFAKWLFDQVEELQSQENGANQNNAGDDNNNNSNSNNNQEETDGGDMEMEDSENVQPENQDGM